jgi:transposase
MVELEGKSQREVALALRHSRKTISKAMDNPRPLGYQRVKEISYPVIGPFADLIGGWLKEDEKVRRKQRHTARRIFQRLVKEYQYQGSYSAVRRHVKRWKREKEAHGEVFLPLVFGPGEEGQVDWVEVWINLSGKEVKVFVFCMRLCYSGASFVWPFRRPNQEAFFQGHVLAFRFFGRIPFQLAYDNLKAAVLKIIDRKHRVVSEGFLELRSHYIFETRFCTVRKGNEKGSVENLGKEVEMNCFTPVPQVGDWEELERHAESWNRKRLEDVIGKRPQAAGLMLEEERGQMRPLPIKEFEACRRETGLVDKFSTVHFDGNRYSAPVGHKGERMEIKGFVDRVEVNRGAAKLGVHRRAEGKGQYILDPYHYLPVLERKPGWLKNGLPFRGDPFGPHFSRLRHELEFRYGDEGTRKYIEVLLLFQDHARPKVQEAVRRCVEGGMFSPEAIRMQMRAGEIAEPEVLNLGGRPGLVGFGETLRPTGVYDGLLAVGGIEAGKEVRR